MRRRTSVDYATIDEGAAGSRRIVKFAYDEPLTLRYSTSSYQGHEDGPSPPAPATGDPDPLTYGNGGRRMWRWERPARVASLGMTPTLIRFPVPAAELAASFHFEVSAPPDVSIVEASLLAGPPNLYMGESPEEDLRAWKSSSNGRTLRRRPSFDSVDGGYPTVDLHVIDVPLGSLSRAQVSLQASTTGWLTTAVASTWLATATLLVGFLANSPAGDLATTVLIGFAAAMVAALARPDPHRMVTRLLSLVRVLVGASAVLTLGGAVAVAFAGGGVAHWCLGIFTLLSCVPTFLVTGTWWRARRRITRENVPVRVPDRLPRPLLERLREKQATQLVRLSPWEQHLPDDIPPSETNPDFHGGTRAAPPTLARKPREADASAIQGYRRRHEHPRHRRHGARPRGRAGRARHPQPARQAQRPEPRPDGGAARHARRVSTQDGVRAIVLDAAGPAFSAGHDLSEMIGRDLPFFQRLFDVCSELMETIHRVPQPVIAKVEGMATAAGCQLVAACDLAVAAEEARFATPGVKIGLFCSTPMVPLSRAIGRKRALDMLLTGRPIDAATALEWGLVNRVVPAEQLESEVAAIVDAVARSSPLTDGDRQGGLLRPDRGRRAPRLRPHEGRDGHERAHRRRPGGHVRLPREAPRHLARQLRRTSRLQPLTDDFVAAKRSTGV